MTRGTNLLGGVAVFLIAGGLAPLGLAQAWVQVQPAGGPPPGRMNNTAVFDPGSGRMIIFGGFTQANSTSGTNDVWVLTGANRKGGQRTWIQLLPNGSSGPPALAAASAVYDPGTNKMIVFGGQYGISQSQVWILENANGLGGIPAWHSVLASGPPARQNHQAVYDPNSNRMIVFGGLLNQGNGTPQLLNDVWVLTNANGTGISSPQWVNVKPTGSTMPSPRHGFAAGYDAKHKRLFIFGGCTDQTWSCSMTSDELWVLTNADELIPLTAWTKLAYTGTGPTAHAQFSSIAYVESTNTLYLFGGRIGSAPPFGTFTNDTWSLGNPNGLGGKAAWTQLNPGNSPSQRGQSVPPNLYDSAKGSMIVFGGPGVNDTFTLDVGPPRSREGDDSRDTNLLSIRDLGNIL